ncbi:MAG: sugar transferase, partial [Anaerolineae bacterium]|nr:sugar transferase [Anaerolineae bacterium]
MARSVLQRESGVRLTFNERRFALIFIDTLLINGSLVLAVVLWTDFPLSVPALVDNFKWFVTLSIVWWILGAALDVYNPVRAASTTYGVSSCGMAALVSALGYQAIPWLTPPLERRTFIFGFTALAIVTVVVWRWLYAYFLLQPGFLRNVLIVGEDATARRLIAELEAATTTGRENPFHGTGYRIAGVISRLPDEEAAALDSAHAFLRMLRTLEVHEVLVAEGGPLPTTMQDALLDCRELGIRVTSLSATYERLTNRLPVEYAERDLSLIASDEESPGERLYGFAKRVMDIVIGIPGVLAMVFMIPPIAVANVLTSPGPLFYYQQRVGRGGQPFAVIKFRTMVPNAEGATGVVWASDMDPRTTPLGKWMRRMRIDEFPQFINVLRGEMSVVGPRPERPQFVGEISRALPIYRVRHAVRPGIT